jgi:hypothetical protein
MNPPMPMWAQAYSLNNSPPLCLEIKAGFTTKFTVDLLGQSFPVTINKLLLSSS